jgi:hypothetical protein
MWGNYVTYQIMRGADGLPMVIQAQTWRCPGSGHSSEASSFSDGDDPSAKGITYRYHTIPLQVGLSANCEPHQLNCLCAATSP